jgi:hypothetical protein
VTRHDCLSTVSRVLGNSKVKKCAVRKKNFLYWADQSSQGRTKISCTGMKRPTNPPRKGPFASVSTFSRGHPSLVSLSTDFQRLRIRVSSETSFDSKQPKLEPKLVSTLSETKCLFRLFRFYTETASFGVSIEPKQTGDQPKQTETNGNESNMKNI